MGADRQCASVELPLKLSDTEAEKQLPRLRRSASWPTSLVCFPRWQWRCKLDYG